MLELKLDLHTRSLFSIGCLLGASWEISKHFFRGRVRGSTFKNILSELFQQICFFHLLLHRYGCTKWEQGQFVFLFLVIFYQHYDKRDDRCHQWSSNCLPFRVHLFFLLDSCGSIFSFLCSFVCPFFIDCSVLRYTVSGYPFGFFFKQKNKIVFHKIQTSMNASSV